MHGVTPAPRRRPVWRQQWALVLAGAVLGAVVGLAFPAAGVALKPLGDVFIALIRMTIAPLIFLVVVTGIAQVGDMRAVGRIGLKALVYFEGITTLCLGISLVVAHYVHPGEGVARATASQAQATTQYAGAHMTSLSAYVVHMVPENFVGAFAAGDVLQILVLAVLSGLALLMLGERGVPLRAGLDHVAALVFGIVHIVILLAPIGAFGAMAFTVGRFGFATLVALLALVGTAWLMMAFFVLVVLGVVTRAAGVRLWDVIGLLRTELLIVIGTSSSETAIPGMMEKLSTAGVGRAVVGLVIPSGYSFNLDGVALTLPLSVLFIAQVYGIPMSFGQQLTLLVVMLFTSKGAAGVTGGGFRGVGGDRRGRGPAGRRAGPPPGHRPLHVAWPCGRERDRQCGCGRGGREMGRRLRCQSVARGCRTVPGDRGQAEHAGRSDHDDPEVVGADHSRGQDRQRGCLKFF